MTAENRINNDFLLDLAARAGRPHAALRDSLDDAQARAYAGRLACDRRTLAVQVQALSCALVHAADQLDAVQLAMLHHLLAALGERIALADDLAVVVDNRFAAAA